MCRIEAQISGEQVSRQNRTKMIGCRIASCKIFSFTIDIFFATQDRATTQERAMEKRPDGWWKKKLVKVKAWTVGQKAEPYFPKEYEIITSDILQVNHPAFLACSLR